MTTTAQHRARPEDGEPASLAAAGAGAWQRDLLWLFITNQMHVALALPVFAVAFALTALSWVEPVAAASWLASCLAAHAVQLFLCRLWEVAQGPQVRTSEWIGMICASEALTAVAWSLPLFMFWLPGNDVQHIYLIAIAMSVIAVRIMIANNFTPVIVAGTGVLCLAIVLRCLMENDFFYTALGLLVVLTEVFFLQLARRLQGTARDMLLVKAEREALIEQLEGARVAAEQARQKAEEANHAKSRFLATMSHELRTPLNAIMGFSEILSKEIMGPHAVAAYKGYSSDIHHSGSYLLNLINDILDLSRIEANRLDLHHAPIDPAALARRAFAMLAPDARRKSQRVVFDLPATALRLLADERAIRQIWLNLMSNAVKFTEDGGCLTVFVRTAADGSLHMGVRDSGPGIPQAEMSSAVAAFSRGSNATRSAVDGAGLGLPIVNGLARLHEGELQISSPAGGGLEATVVFPARRVIGNARLDLADATRSMPDSQRRLVELTG